jgi:hypothetical protein
MSWDVAVYADLAFPEGGLEKWATLVADMRRFADWKDDFTSQTAPQHLAPRPVGEVIAALEAANEEFLRFDRSEQKARLRALLAKDSYYDWCVPIATIVRVAADAGGRGDAFFVGYMTIRFGYRYRVGNGTSSFEKLDDAALEAADRSPAFREVDAMVQERLQKAKK